MTKTTNYQLPKREKTDRIQMKDFNDMTATLDAALGTIPKLAVGTYTGDGTYGSEHKNSITFAFAPTMVLIFCPESQNSNALCFSNRNGTAYPFTGNNGIFVQWNGNTISWWHSGDAYRQFNQANYRYLYLAV